ncbi:MAG: DsbE family thiol:disulfide interchange protein [Parvibaculales bacterium]
MPKNLMRFIPVLVFAGLVVLFAVGLRQGDPSKLPTALLNKPLPDFTLPGLDSSEIVAAAPALLNVWASWCGPCREEHPHLMTLAQNGVPVFGINYKDDPGAAQRFLSGLGDPYRASGKDESGSLAIHLGVYGVPETFVIGAGGTIIYRHAGPLDETVLAQTIMPLVQPALGPETDTAQQGK